jgi:hypothetical protein
MTTDHDALFTAWVERTAASLRGTAYLMCGDWHAADDVVQDALVRVYERWHRIRPEAATSSPQSNEDAASRSPASSNAGAAAWRPARRSSSSPSASPCSTRIASAISAGFARSRG